MRARGKLACPLGVSAFFSLCSLTKILVSPWISPLRLPSPERKTTTVSDTSEYESARRDKLQKIANLGIDPWGHRFDGAAPIQQVLALSADQPEGQRPSVRVAGRIVGRRIGGK